MGNLPRKPYCTDEFGYGVVVRPAEIATRKRYLQINEPWCLAFLVFDVDRSDGAVAWEEAGLPMPVWVARNPENGHAHCVWMLEVPVLRGKNCSRQARQWCAAIVAAMTAVLGADPMYTGLITKNPIHRDWTTHWAPVGMGIYSLGYLAEFLKKIPKSIRREIDGAAGRNVDLFHRLRRQAYRDIKDWPAAEDWDAHLYHMAENINADYAPALPYREIRSIVRSVSKWTMSRFDIEASWERFSAKQARRGAKGGIASGISRTSAASVQRDNAAYLITTGLTQAEIAAALNTSERTVRRWIADHRRTNDTTYIPTAAQRRQTALDLLAAGKSQAQTAKIVGVTQATVSRWFSAKLYKPDTKP